LNRRISFTPTNDIVEGVVARASGCLADERPADVALGGHQVQVVKVTQEAKASLPRPFEELGVKVVGFIVGLFAVAVGERLQFGRVVVAPHGEAFANVQDIGFILMRLSHCAVRGSEIDLCLVQQPEIVAEIHDVPPSFVEVAIAASPPVVAGIAPSIGAGPPTVGAGDGCPCPSRTLRSPTAATL
jgi:hypothetical protein